MSTSRIEADAASPTTATTAEREIVLSRVFDAPRALVFDAWTRPEHIAQWWGPRGFTTTTHSMDFRVGGVWRFVMHGPDGTDYPNDVRYTEIVKPERLAYGHGSDDGGDPNFSVVVTFAERGGSTEITMRMILASAEELRRMREFGAVEGGKQTLDRLGEFLAAR
ncbi:MAG TPA: SRPBCC family protein [Longimicrobium sp.]|nr:SRPBCC family protein [Longimicrobium sp.]